jgi:hypothetical protein
MADALGVQVPFKVDGISQLSDSRARTDKFFYNEPGERIEFPAAPAFHIVQDGATGTVVRAADGRAGLFVTGSRPDWIGKSVTSIRNLGVDVTGPASPMTVQISDEIHNCPPAMTAWVPAASIGR